MRGILGIIVGLVVGVVATIIAGIIGVGATFTAPAGIDASDTRQVLEAFAGMPTAARIALMVAWFVGGLLGAVVAKLISRRAWAAWAVAILIAAYVALNMLVLPMPGWMQALSVIAPLIGGLFANHLVKAAPAVTVTEVEGPPAQP